MGETFTQFFVEHLPSAVIIVCAAIALLMFIIWWAARIWYKFKDLPCSEHSNALASHSDKISGITTSFARLETLPCADHSNTLSGHSGKISDISSTLSGIESKLDLLIKMIPLLGTPKESVLSNDNPSLSQKHSPRVLNENGNTVSSLFKCREFFSGNKAWLVEELEKFKPKTALDAESLSMVVMKISSSDDRFNTLKNEIYRSPSIPLKDESGNDRNYEINLEDILFIISIYLRDEYLQLHPEILC